MRQEIWYTQYNNGKIFHQKTLRVQVKALVTFLSYKEELTNGLEEYLWNLKLQAQFEFILFI